MHHPHASVNYCFSTPHFNPIHWCLSYRSTNPFPIKTACLSDQIRYIKQRIKCWNKEFLFFWQYAHCVVPATQKVGQRYVHRCVASLSKCLGTEEMLELWKWNVVPFLSDVVFIFWHIFHVVAHVAQKPGYITNRFNSDSLMCKVPMPCALMHPHTIMDPGCWAVS